MRYRKKWIKMVFLFFIIGILTFIPGCDKKSENQEQTTKTVVYKIGAVLPLSGKQSYFGDESKTGIEHALAELKDELTGKDIDLRVIYEDSQNIPGKTAGAAINLLNVNKVNCLISLFPMCPVVNGVTQNSKDVLHLAATMSPDIVKPANTIRIYPSQVEEAQKMIEYMKSIQAKRVAIFHLSVKAHEETAAHFILVLEKEGIAKLTETMAFTDVDAKTQMQKIKDFKPDILMLILLPDFHQKVFKAIHDVGGFENCKIIGNISFLYPTKETKREWLENVVFVAPKPFIGGVNLQKEFQETFKDKSKMEPTIVSTFLYINMKILGKALLNGKTSSQDIIDFLTTTKQFNTVAGEIEILPDGDCTVSLSYGVIKDGKRSLYQLEQNNQ